MSVSDPFTQEEDVFEDDVFEDDDEYSEEISEEVSLDLPASPELNGFSLAFEDRPVYQTRSRVKKVILAWEQYLDFLTSEENTGKTVRVFSFSGDEAKKNAQARARSIRSRLIKSQPHQEYLITVDEIKDADVPMFNVYASYTGPASEETVQARHDEHERRVAHGQYVASLRAKKAAEAE